MLPEHAISVNHSQHTPEIPSWLLIGTAICILVPDIILLYQLTPAFRLSHTMSPALRVFGATQAEWHIGSFVAELIRPALSLFVTWCVLRRRFLTVAVTYLGLRIVVPLLLALCAPQVFGWSFAPIALHAIAIVGVFYIRGLNGVNAR